MSSRHFAASRRRALLTTSFLVPILTLAAAPVQAEPATALPAINVNATRVPEGIVGASTTVITAEDIAHSPAATVQDIIAQAPGVQLQSVSGGVNGAGTAVDLRGFGAFASANTLVLINGRRLNDLDLAGVDLSTLPRDSIDRIEITRGNSGAVLYGDNAVGGVINIVTKTGAGGPPVAMRIEGGAGSFNQRMAAVSVATNAGPWSGSFFGNAVKSDGYRVNNALDQRNGVGELRYATPDFTAFVNLSADDQKLGLPGVRRVYPNGLNELISDRRGANTPFDYAAKQGVNVTTGFTKSLVNGVELIVDGGVRDKQQQSAFFGEAPLQSWAAKYVDTNLRTWSITPRLSIKNPVFGLPSSILTGIDYYDATYQSDRSQYAGTAPIHSYDLTQRTLSAYWQQTLAVLPSTDLSYGARVQNTRVTASDRLDINAPGYWNIGDLQAAPLDSDQVNHALHIGLEHRLNDTFTLFARAASAYRTPNVDERVAAGPSFDPLTFAPLPRVFDLKTQTSHDVEGGVRFQSGPLQTQTSVYHMELSNELHFNPVLYANYNLDPTRRYGGESSASLRVSDTLLLRGSAAYTRAVFRDGAFTGNDVPLVSRYTASAGVTWNIWQKYAVLDATVRYWSSRRMDNDQANFQPMIPANATVDLKLSGEVDRFFWSLSAQNLFNAEYYDYAIASAVTAGRYNAYPLPGRTYMVKLGATF
jgi:iron complex outermembrane recepter protein